MGRKMQQKRAYDKRAGQPLTDFAPQTNAYAKPPPTSPAKAWIPGLVVCSAGHRSYIIKTTAEHIRRNRTQIRESPPLDTHGFPPSFSGCNCSQSSNSSDTNTRHPAMPNAKPP